MQQDKKTIDPYLMGAILKGNSNGRYNIKKIKRLELTDAAIAPYADKFRIKEHDFSVIEEMENLRTLTMTTRKPLTIKDFSFLEIMWSQSH